MAHERLFARALVRVAPEANGEDAAQFLQGLVTNDVTGELPVYAGLLSAQGKTLFDFIVWPGSEGSLLLDCEAEFAGELVKRLSLYRLRRKIAIAVDDGLGVYWQAELGDGGAPDPRMAGLGQRWIAATSDGDRAVPVRGSGDPSLAEARHARIGRAAVAELGLPIHPETVIDGDRDLAPQAIERQPFDQLPGEFGFAIEQQRTFASRPDDEVEQRLALRAQEPGIDRQFAGHVVGDEALQKLRRILAVRLGRDAHERARE